MRQWDVSLSLYSVQFTLHQFFIVGIGKDYFGLAMNLNFHESIYLLALRIKPFHACTITCKSLGIFS